MIRQIIMTKIVLSTNTFKNKVMKKELTKYCVLINCLCVHHHHRQIHQLLPPKAHQTSRDHISIVQHSHLQCPQTGTPSLPHLQRFPLFLFPSHLPLRHYQWSHWNHSRNKL